MADSSLNYSHIRLLTEITKKNKMNRLNNVWNDLHEKETDVQILNYWEDRQARILQHLKAT